MILPILIYGFQQRELDPREIFGPGRLDYRGDLPITRVATKTEIGSVSYKLFVAGNYREAAKAALDSLAKKPDSVFQIKVSIDSLRQVVPSTEIQKKLVEAMFSRRNELLRTEAGRIAACYASVALREIAKFEHQKLDSGLTSQLSSVADFGKIKFTGNLAFDLTIASFGTHSLSQEVRAILKKDLTAYPNEPFFPACIVEEYTAGYKEGQEVGFKPDWGPDWIYVGKLCDSSIKKWPTYPTFYLYKGLDLKRSKDFRGALPMFLKYRELINSRGGSRVYNTDLVIDQLKKLG